MILPTGTVSGTMVKPVRPPWRLTGSGYILLFKFPKAFVDAHGFIPPFLRGQFAGGIGAVVLANYESSAVGPYQEALFIPGRFNHRGRLAYTVTKIYVSTMASVISGRNNWGLPKELASFEVHKAKATERITVSHNAHPILDITLQPSRLGLPVTSALLFKPWRTLVQYDHDLSYVTTLAGRGWLGPARVLYAGVEAGFPDFSQFKPLTVASVPAFTLHFPVPRVAEG